MPQPKQQVEVVFCKTCDGLTTKASISACEICRKDCCPHCASNENFALHEKCKQEFLF